jgi:hypothetical protein
MNKVFEGIRPTDVVLAIVMSVLGVYLMLENINSTASDVRVDSTSWLLIPVFLAATIPVLWRRRSILTVTLATAAALAAHVAAFGWDVRCGAGLPLAVALAYAAGRFVTDRRQSALTMVLTLGVQGLVLVRDSAAGLEILPVTAVIGVAAWAIGMYVTTRISSGASVPAEDAVPVSAYR